MRLSLTITESQANSMIAHAQHGLPSEACGLLGGKSGHVSTVYPGTNAEHSPIRYLLDPIDQFNAMKMIDQNGEDLIGIFHSHPKGVAIPSEIDITQAYYPKATYVILARHNKKDWYMRAYYLVEGQINEVKIRRINTQHTILEIENRTN